MVSCNLFTRQSVFVLLIDENVKMSLYRILANLKMTFGASLNSTLVKNCQNVW